MTARMTPRGASFRRIVAGSGQESCQIMIPPDRRRGSASLETACDIAFAAASVYFARLKEEKARIEEIERNIDIVDLTRELEKSLDALPDLTRTLCGSNLD